MKIETRNLDITLDEYKWRHIDLRAQHTGADAAAMLAAAASMEIDRRETLAEGLPRITTNESIPLPPRDHPSPANPPRCINCGAPISADGGGEWATCGRGACIAAVAGNRITSAEEGAPRMGQLPTEQDLIAAAGRGMVPDDSQDPELI